MANQLFGFSPEAFEQFVRALAIQVFGPGVTAFGNGPDGGREATFRGNVPYPFPPTTNWSGYGVIQAKCKEKTETTDKDQIWAINQLRRELELFVENVKRDPKPEYYIFATNVELTSASGGGRDQAEELVRSYYKTLPLKDHAIWDANQLASYLNSYEGLRRRFSAYTTPGDVLAALLADIEQRTPHATRILTAFLEREVRRDAFFRLDQAGDRTESRYAATRLFFDLPASPEPRSLPPDEQPNEEGELPCGVLSELLRAGARILDPKALLEQETLSEQAAKTLPTRYVLLGGPGSGKSTLGQILAQIHRCALLERCTAALLDPHIRQIIRETHTLCERERLAWPNTPRYPFRIELNRFAKALASRDTDHVESLGQYLLNELKRDHVMTHADLLDWLRAYPWLLVFDGLDEVPATSNRDALVATVTDFLAEARNAEADLFVVATSREQGYSQEFAGTTTAFRYLLPLSQARALRYVERYVEAQYGSRNEPIAQDVIQRLANSARRELTSQLMSSPLQVTFMATVVAAQGDPGDGRWQLFEAYYRTIYDRERQKAVRPFDEVLSKYKAIIDQLHHDVGFLLQYSGEGGDGAGVTLRTARFHSLVDAYLAEIGQKGEEKERLLKLIVEAANTRLVFLVSRVPGELSFDVRSLQEYMAAEWLMSDESEVIKARLKAIAPAPYWRNVFLFAANKCFCDAPSRYLRDSIRVLCDDLNNSSDPVLVTTKAGSELALDIIQSGAVAQDIACTQYLARIALELIRKSHLLRDDEECGAVIDKLRSIYTEELKAIYHDFVESQIQCADPYRTVAAWSLLVRLINDGVDWAIELGERYWPNSCDAQTVIVTSLPMRAMITPWVWDKLQTTLWQVPPRVVAGRLRKLALFRGEEVNVTDSVGAILRVVSVRCDQVVIPLETISDSRGTIRMSVVSATQSTGLAQAYEILAQSPSGHVGWLPFTLANEFVKSPCAQTLGDILTKCADEEWLPSEKTLQDSLPWPLACCLSSVQSVEELRGLADRIKKGELGDYCDWKAWEKQWESKGIALDDCVEASKGDNLVSRPLAVFCTLNPAARYSFDMVMYPDAVLRKLADIAMAMKPCSCRNLVLWCLCVVGRFTGGIVRCLTPREFQSLLQVPGQSFLVDRLCIAPPDDNETILPWVAFFDWLGRSEVLSMQFGRCIFPEQREWSRRWSSIFEKTLTSQWLQGTLSPTASCGIAQMQTGLLRILGRFASAGETMQVLLAEMLNPGLYLKREIRLGAILVRMTQGTLGEKESRDLADETVTLLCPAAEPGVMDYVFLTAEANLDRVPAIETYLLRLHERMPPEIKFGHAKCEYLLRQMLRRRRIAPQSVDPHGKLSLAVVELKTTVGIS